MNNRIGILAGEVLPVCGSDHRRRRARFRSPDETGPACPLDYPYTDGRHSFTQHFHDLALLAFWMTPIAHGFMTIGPYVFGRPEANSAEEL